MATLNQQEVTEVTAENFQFILEYANQKMGTEWHFSPTPVERFQAIPDQIDPEGAAITALSAWIRRHLKKSTRERMFQELRIQEFERAKGSTQVALSKETRLILKAYRDQLFGEGKGSTETAVRKLLESAHRTLSPQAYQKLEAFRQEQGLDTLDQAVDRLTSRVEPDPTNPPLKEALEALLNQLKSTTTTELEPYGQ
ncbi:MAG: hypothetical protein HQL52_00590 [Magnetococcales bacterium]|nr:hypothetical protein [Magnetococcales bacterium]